MNHIWLKTGDDFQQHVVVVRLQRFHLRVFCDERMIESAIQPQPPFDEAIALLILHPVTGRENECLMPAQSQRFAHFLAAEIISPRVVRRVKVGENKDFQGVSVRFNISLLITRWFFDEVDFIADLDFSRRDDLRQNAQSVAFTQFAQALANVVHLLATSPRFVKI